MDDFSSLGTEFHKKSPIKFEVVSKLSSHDLKNRGYPWCTFSWEFCRKWDRGEVLQDHCLLLLHPLHDNNLKEAKTSQRADPGPVSTLERTVDIESQSMWRS